MTKRPYVLCVAQTPKMDIEQDAISLKTLTGYISWCYVVIFGVKISVFISGFYAWNKHTVKYCEFNAIKLRKKKNK